MINKPGNCNRSHARAGTRGMARAGLVVLRHRAERTPASQQPAEYNTTAMRLWRLPFRAVARWAPGPRPSPRFQILSRYLAEVFVDYNFDNGAETSNYYGNLEQVYLE